MKKIIATAMFLLLALSFAACNRSDNSTTNTTNKPDSVVEEVETMLPEITTNVSTSGERTE